LWTVDAGRSGEGNVGVAVEWRVHNTVDAGRNEVDELQVRGLGRCW
jgi:hypothetical protein